MIELLRKNGCKPWNIQESNDFLQMRSHSSFLFLLAEFIEKLKYIIQWAQNLK